LTTWQPEDKGKTNPQCLFDIVEYFEICLVPGLTRSIRHKKGSPALLPAFLQVLSLVLEAFIKLCRTSRLLEAHSRTVKLSATPDFKWLAKINEIQLIDDLSTLLSLRRKLNINPHGSDYSIFSILKFADWEAALFVLEALVEIFDPDNAEAKEIAKRNLSQKYLNITVIERIQALCERSLSLGMYTIALFSEQQCIV